MNGQYEHPRASLRVAAPLAVMLHHDSQTDLCVTRNFSLGGLAVLTQLKLERGILLTVTFVGTSARNTSAVAEVVRVEPGAIALKFLDRTMAFQMKLEDVYNAYLASKGHPKMPRLPKDLTVCWQPLGHLPWWRRWLGASKSKGALADLQNEGAAVHARRRPAIDTEIEFGIPLAGAEKPPQTRARVVRHTEEGFAVAFVEPTLEFRQVISSLRRHDAEQTDIDRLAV